MLTIHLAIHSDVLIKLASVQIPDLHTMITQTSNKKRARDDESQGSSEPRSTNSLHPSVASWNQFAALVGPGPINAQSPGMASEPSALPFFLPSVGPIIATPQHEHQSVNWNQALPAAPLPILPGSGLHHYRFSGPSLFPGTNASLQGVPGFGTDAFLSDAVLDDMMGGFVDFDGPPAPEPTWQQQQQPAFTK